MSEQEKTLQNPTAMNKQYSMQIARNLQKLMQTTGITQNQLAESLCENGLNVNQGTISKYLKGTVDIQLSVVIKLCQIYNMKLEDLISENFVYTNRQISTGEPEEARPRREDSSLYIPRLGNKFITDPTDRDFSGYLQNYYCYFYPTLSDEDTLLRGMLTLGGIASGAEVCEASLILDTNRRENGDPIYKTYTGCAIISTSVHALYIILSSPDEGEICLINLRHFFIRHRKLNCRLAEVITNAAGESHAPTVHRMLLSRQEISEEHLEYIKPQLHLNSNDILISEDELQAFAAKSPEHEKLVKHLTYVTEPKTLYTFREDFVRSNALQFLPKDRILSFLAEIRMHAHKMRYNKVSNKADENVHHLLNSLGYYTDQNK